MTPSVRRSTLREETYHAVRNLIMEHDLKPGERINIDELTRQLDVSHTPLREALARLEAEDLVRLRPLVGYTVAPLLDATQFDDLFRMRELLECAAAELAARNATDAERTGLLRAAEAPPKPARRSGGWRSHAAFTAADAHFHDLLAAASGSPLLRDGVRRLHAHLHLHRRHLPYERSAETLEEHRRIAAAVAQGRGEAAAEAMRAHLAGSRDRHWPATEE
jgi:DNA-binding GntR family transcriptional regulator